MKRLWLCLSLLALFPARSAWAQASCVLREIEGKKAAGGIDPRLEDVKSMLSRQPFASYGTFQLTSVHPLVLKKGGKESGTLSNRHRFDLSFLERLSAREGRARLRLRFEIWAEDGKPELNTIFAVDEGGAPFTHVEQAGDKLFVKLIGCRTP